MSISVSATRGWVLAIGNRETRDARRAEWSHEKTHGVLGVAEFGGVVAKGRSAAAPIATELFLRGSDSTHSAVLLTIAAP
jgi:hypothetical protein